MWCLLLRAVGIKPWSLPLGTQHLGGGAALKTAVLMSDGAEGSSRGYEGAVEGTPSPD